MEPVLEIVEQPKSRGYRFRYECEGGSHGNITGAKSSKGQRTYPTVKLANWNGYARISVQCVTDEEKPKSHTHELIGKNCKDGICVIELKPSDKNIARFDGLSIKHSTRKRAIEILTLRNQEAILQEKRQKGLSHGVQNFGYDLILTENEKLQAYEEAKQISPQLDLSVVRLLFKANLLNDPIGPILKTLEVVSNSIYDAKSPGAAALRICRMDKSSGSCVGDEEIFLLCDKVQKDDIAVCFEECDNNGVVKWASYGKFGPQDVHRQFAIVFRTPQYRSTRIDSPVEVKVKLKRLSKPEESNGVSFTYHPEQQDEDQIKLKRKKKLSHHLLDRFPNHGADAIQNNIHIGTSNGVVAGNGSLKRNTICAHPAMSHMQGGQSNGTTIFPINATLPSMTLPNLHQMMPSPQAPSPASSFMSSPKQSPSPQSFCDQTIECYQPLEYDMPMYEQVSPFQGRGLPDKGFEPSIKREPAELPRHEFHSQPVHILDLSKPVDLSVSKLKTDSDTVCDSGIKVTLNSNLIMNNAKSTPLNENSGLLKTKSADAKTKLAKQVVQFGDRLFKALQKYAQTGDVGILLMVQRHLLTQQDENGDNVLHLAIIHSKCDALRKLLKVSSTLPEYDIINNTNKRCQTPLHLATILRDAVLVEILLCHGASISMFDHCGNTPIHLAVIHKAPQCLSLMLAYLVEKNKGKSPEVDMLNYKGLAPLHLAVLVGHIDCIKALVEIGKANVNMEDGCSGKTPLHYAVEKDRLAIVGYLISQPNVDVNAPDFSSLTPLHMAVQLRLQGCTSLLMAAGADPDVEIIEKVADSGDESSSDYDVSEEEGMSKKEKQRQKEMEKDTLTVVVDDDDKTIKLSTDTVVLTAWTMAEGDEVIESILRCEECTDPGNTIQSIKISELIHDVTTKENSHLYTVPSGRTTLDMIDLDAMVRKKLAELLDPTRANQDWKALAQRLDMPPLIVEAFEYMSSPTITLLDNFQATEGSVEKLIAALVEIKREDAAKLVDEVKKQKEVARFVYGKPDLFQSSSDRAQLESGIESLTLST